MAASLPRCDFLFFFNDERSVFVAFPLLFVAMPMVSPEKEGKTKRESDLQGCVAAIPFSIFIRRVNDIFLFVFSSHPFFFFRSRLGYKYKCDTAKRSITCYDNGLNVSGCATPEQFVEKVDANGEWKGVLPKLSMLILIFRWAKKPTRYFYDDLINFVTVMLDEFEYDVTSMFGTRAFCGVVPKNKKDPVCEYRRLEQCITVLEGGQEQAQAKIRRLRRTMDNLESVLLANEIFLENWTGKEDHCTYLLEVMKKESWLSKFAWYALHFHMSWILINALFVPLLHSQKRSQQAIVDIHSSIFGNCKNRRDFVCAMVDFAMLFPTQMDAIRNGGALCKLLANPSKAVDNIRSDNKGDWKEHWKVVKTRFKTKVSNEYGKKKNHATPWSVMPFVHEKIFVLRNGLVDEDSPGKKFRVRRTYDAATPSLAIAPERQRKRKHIKRWKTFS